MKISIIGAGYVGVVTGACLAEFGHDVACCDTDAAKVALLSRAKSPIYEPGLDALLERHVGSGKLVFTTETPRAAADAEIIFIAVGTPTSRRGNGYADMSYVHDAVRAIAPHLSSGQTVVNKSTVPMGSARQVARLIAETNPKASCRIASNPEFLRQGAAIEDFLKPDRVVVGVDSPEAETVLRKVYAPLIDKKVPFVVASLETAELIKYAANAFLAMKISFINEMANLCEAVGGDVDDLAYAIGLDRRIGPQFLQAGPGFGGSCFPKDTTALMRMAQEHGSHCRLVETTVEVNHAQRARMVSKIRQALGDGFGKTLAVLGLTFKPDTDDLREAPSLTILPALAEKGVRIVAHDPVGMEEAAKHLPGVRFASDPYAACEGADGVCLMTEWADYKNLDLAKLRKTLKTPLFIDLRNIYRPQAMEAAGFNYVSVGRKN